MKSLQDKIDPLNRFSIINFELSREVYSILSNEFLCGTNVEIMRKINQALCDQIQNEITKKNN